MGNNPDKASNPQKKQPVDLDPYSTEIFTRSYPNPCTIKSFSKHLNITYIDPLDQDDLKELPKLPMPRHLSIHRQNLILRMFQGFLNLESTSNSSNSSELTLQQYINGMKLVLTSKGEQRLDFLLSTLPLRNPDSYDPEVGILSVLSLFNEVISLCYSLHKREESLIEQLGFCIEDEEIDTNFSRDPDSSFVPVSKLKQPQNTNSPNFEREEKLVIEKVSEENDEFESKNKPSGRYDMSFSVPKDKNQDILPTKHELEAEIQQELANLKMQEISKSKKQLDFSNQVVLSLINSLLKTYRISEIPFSVLDQHSQLFEADFLSKSQISIDESHSSSNSSETLPTHIWIGLSKVKSWILGHFPKFADILQSLIQIEISAPLREDASEFVKKSYKRVAALPDGVSMEMSQIWTPSTIWSIHHLFEITNIGSWKLLYNSQLHGHSLNRFIHHVVGYRSETLFIIQTKKNEVFGAFVSKPWELGSTFFGTSDCFLFGITPILAIKHTQHNAPKNYAYFFNNKKSFSGKPVGIGFGGTPGHFRLFVDEDLMTGFVRTIDPTYESGPISPNTTFDIACIEVWGSSTDYAESGLLRERRLREKDAERARKAVDKGQAWNEGPDKFIMDLMGKTGASNGIVESIEQERRKAKEKELLLKKAEEKQREAEAQANASSSTSPKIE